mgnify:CR=1 FL=1
MVIGVTEGYEKKLELVGVGYRAKTQGQRLELALLWVGPVASAAAMESEQERARIGGGVVGHVKVVLALHIIHGNANIVEKSRWRTRTVVYGGFRVCAAGGGK